MWGRNSSKLEETYAEVRKMAPAFVSYYNRADAYLQNSLFKEEMREEILSEIFIRLRKLDCKGKSPSELLPPEELSAYLVEEVKAEADVPGVREYFIWEIVAGFLSFYLGLNALIYLIGGRTGEQTLGWEVVFLTILAPLALWTLVGVVTRAAFNQIRRHQLKWYLLGFMVIFAVMILIWGYGPWTGGAPGLKVTPVKELTYAAVLVLTVWLAVFIRGRVGKQGE